MQRAWRWWSVVAGALVVSRAHPPDLLVAGATPARAAVRASSGRGVAPPPSHSPADMPNAWAITDSEAESDGGRQAPRLRGRPPVSWGGLPLTALRLARSNRPHDRAPSSPRRSACGPGSASAGMTLRGGGGTCEQMLVAALRRPTNRSQEQLWADLLDAWVGGRPTLNAPIGAEAAILNHHRQSLGPYRSTFASAVYVASRSWLSSFVAHLRQAISTGEFVPIAAFTWSMYDSTTMWVAADKGAASATSARRPMVARYDEVAAQPPAVSQARAEDDPEEARPVRQWGKIMQTDGSTGFLLERRGSRAPLFIEVPMLFPLQLLDHSTARAVKQAKEEAFAVGLLAPLLATFAVVVDVTSADRAAENNSAEGGISAEKGERVWRWRNSCCAHGIHTAMGRGLDVVPGSVSGLVAFALAQRPGGAVAKLRQALGETLEASLDEIICGPGPPPGDPAMVRRDALLEQCLPDTPRGRQRKHALRALITSDTAFSRCTFYTTGPPPSKAAWARAVARNLLPSAVPVLQRARWLLNEESFAAAALLHNTFNVLSRAVPRWIAHMRQEAPPPAVAPWDAISDSEPEEPADWRSATGIDWKLFHSAQEHKTGRWARATQTRWDLLVATVAFQPLTKLLHAVLDVESEDWLSRAERRAWGSGQPPHCRGRAAVSLHWANGYFEAVADLLHHPGHPLAEPDGRAGRADPWRVMPPHARTLANASMAFAMLARVAAAVEQLVRAPCLQFPTRLFELLDGGADAADAVLRTCPNERDEFTRSFLRRFGTREALLSRAARQILHCLDRGHRLTTSQVECRFAGLRRRLRADGGTRGRHFADLSAAFLLQRARILERPGPAKRRGRPCRRSARRRGGGGTHRAAMAAVLHEAWGTGCLGGARDRPSRRALWQELHREAWRRRRAGGGGRGRDVGRAGAGHDQGATVAGTQSSCNGAVGR